MECKSFITPSSSRGSDSALDIQEFELTPLEKGLKYEEKERRRETWQTRKNGMQTSSTSWRGPIRAMRLVILVALLPALLIAVPLYLRYYVFSGQLYPVGMSDMRLIDKKVSTTWCQRQLLHSNATFNAFLVASQPDLASELVPVSMTRELSLEDDMKEYWGFYLLQGSSVTVSTCVRWPGASLIMIRGHKHLQECAYIGDDSSEELEEILRANGGKLDNATIQKLIADQPTNRPEDMTRHLIGVKFHEPRLPAEQLNRTEEVHMGRSDEKDTPDSQMLKKILGQLRFKQDTKKKAKVPHERPSYIVPVPQLVHRYRDTNINEGEGAFLSFKDLEEKSPVGEKMAQYKSDTLIQQKKIVKVADSVMKIDKNPHVSGLSPDKIQLNATEDSIDKLRREFDEDVAEINAVQQSSSEIFEDIFNKLNSLGVRGKNVLDRLNQKLASDVLPNRNMSMQNSTNSRDNLSEDISLTEEPEALSEEDVAEKKIETLRVLIQEIMEEQKKIRKDRKARRLKDEPVQKRKRELMIEQTLRQELNEHDEKGNAAIEEGFEPDGIADHHVRLNETTPNDMSHSEFWSSFSSSEEALLECEGLILNLPLTPHKSCEALGIDDHAEASRANTVTYRVPTNGYYFFVFNSENEVQTNYIRVRFDMMKTMYDLKGTLMECKNSTDKCAMPLAFFSGEKVVFEVPLRDNDSLWNEEFVVISECEPRTAIYVFCVIAVPLLIVIMAFH